MKKLIFAALIFSACTSQPDKDLSKEAEKAIREADVAMSDIALKEGFFNALLLYAEDSAILPREGKMPLIGKNNAGEAWPDKESIKEISWKPFRAEASGSGDMGYTFGFWEYKGKDTTTYGNYCTIWRKQKDGSWKYIFDGGNTMPGPWK